MITTPDRLKGLIEKIEADVSPQEVSTELKKIASLQPLDLAVASRQFVEEAVKFQEQENERAVQGILDSFGSVSIPSS